MSDPKTPSGGMVFTCLALFIAGLFLFAVLHSRNDQSEQRPTEVVPKTKPAIPVQQPAPTPPAVSAQAPTKEAAQTEDEGAAALANARYTIGTQFGVGYFSCRVNKVEVKLDPYRGPLLAVDMTIRNDDTSETMTPMLRLLDENGKKLGSSILALATPSGDDVLTELRPNVTYRGYAAFDNVPVNGKYILLISGGLTSGKSAIVPLFQQSETVTIIGFLNSDWTLSQIVCVEEKCGQVKTGDLSILKVTFTDFNLYALNQSFLNKRVQVMGRLLQERTLLVLSMDAVTEGR